MVGSRDDAGSLHAERIVGPAARQPRKAEAQAELHTLDGGNAEQQRGQRAFHAAEKRLAQARGQAQDNRFQNPSHGIALGGGRLNGLRHGAGAQRVQHRKIRGVQCVQLLLQPRRVAGKGRVVNARALRQMCGDGDALCLQQFCENAARRHNGGREPSAEMPAAPRVLMAAVLHVGGVIRVAGAQQLLCFCIIAAAGIGVFNHKRQRRTRGRAPVYARKHAHRVRLCAGSGYFSLGAAFFHLPAHEFHVHGHAGRKARHCGAHSGAVALAEDRERDAFAVRVAHRTPSPMMAFRSSKGTLSSLHSPRRGTFTTVMAPSGPVFLS